MKTLPLSLFVVASAAALAACETMDETDSGMQSSASTASSASASASANPIVGGQEMFPTKTIVENAVNSADHTTLVAAVEAAGLVDTLNSAGPFTVFAPVNAAFDRLAPGTVESLMKPENKAALTKVLTYHVVPGTLLAADLASRIQAGGGTATLTTVEGEPLTLTMDGNAVKITDVHGNASFVTQADVRQSNGVIHVVNGVLLPTLG